jgi:hypothetical protein
MIDVILTIASLWLGSMFLYSGAIKLARYDHVGVFVQQYDVLPPKLGYGVGLTLPWVELAAGVLFVTSWTNPVGPILGVGLGASFASAAFRVLRRNVDVPCGCGGYTDERVSKTTLSRGVVIASFSLLLVAAGPVSLPPTVIAAVISLSVVPGGIVVYRRLRRARAQHERIQQKKAEVARLTSVLANPVPDSTMSTA